MSNLHKNIYRLEYSLEQQQFHLENLSKPNVKEENTHGWVTIAKGEDSKLNKFIDYMEMLEYMDQGYEKPFTINTVKKEWKSFSYLFKKIGK